MKRPKRSPQASHMARGVGRWKPTRRHTGTGPRASSDSERASQSEEGIGTAGSGKELSCWPRELLEVEIHQVVKSWPFEARVEKLSSFLCSQRGSAQLHRTLQPHFFF